VGFVVEKVALVQVFRVLRFPLAIRIPPIAQQSSSLIIWGVYNRPELASVPNGLSPTSLLIVIKIIIPIILIQFFLFIYVQT
jgi:hypothetical protein